MCTLDPKRWHKSIRKLASNGCAKVAGPPVVQSLVSFSDSAKADVIADTIEEKTAHYPPLDVGDIFDRFSGGMKQLLSVKEVALAI